MKKAELIFVISLALFLVISGVKDVRRDYDHLRESVVRIHILANSDSEEDQALKLEVRDEILSYTDQWLSECKSVSEARDILEGRMDEIQQIAAEKIRNCGYDYPAESELVNMRFDDRVYGNITMPEGNYDAVRVTIGEAAGHNWWCVMYPPLCIPAAGDELDIADYSGYFTEGEIDIMKNCSRYKVRLKCAELIDMFSGSEK